MGVGGGGAVGVLSFFIRLRGKVLLESTETDSCNQSLMQSPTPDKDTSETH